ncbi:MAG: Rab family GTPase [Candidatus Hodarchaeota archaeon]
MFHKSFVFKILIAGDGGVGKTTLLRRYVDGVFDESTIETVGVDFFLKELKFEDLRLRCSLQLWDLGGQERFRHLLDSFIMGARGALLLFDLTRMPKMDKILNWVNIVRLHDINLPIALVGTKLDLEDAIAVDDEYAFTIKNTFNMIDYFKTSSKNGYNVVEVFEVLAKELMKKSKY